MAKVAQVIVDVPTMQTNHPYSYEVPAKWADLVQVGMRVVVPFGKGHRNVQGFVVSIDQPVKYSGELRPLGSLMDMEPVINKELLQLSKWMADDTYSFWISCLYAMIPAALKGKTKRIVRVVDEISEKDATEIFHNLDQIDFAEVSANPEIVQRIRQLQRQKKVVLDYQVKNQAKAKKITGIKANLDFQRYEDERQAIAKNAHAQNKLISFLQTLGERVISQKEAEKRTGLSAATFRLGEKRGWLVKVPIETYRRPGGDVPSNDHLTQPLQLNQEQSAAFQAISQAIRDGDTKPFLLEGVTGSGKTEVYLQSIATALSQGKTALMLVPEISLTPQMVHQLRGRFGKKVAILHSSLSRGERYDEWRRIERGQAKVVVGARSAIFAPLQNLGLIIIDEEHEPNYKQEDSPRYQARRVAQWRGRYNQAVVVLGSATPSLESRSRAHVGVYHLLRMKHRVNHHPLPTTEIVDMRPVVQREGETNFSPRLLALLADRLQKHEQSILMLNRRGFSSFVMCRDCGFVLKCPNCDISLTLHMASHTMRCHYCGHEEPIPRICPKCHGHKIRYYGTGTEKVASQLSQFLPQARVIRMDVDTTRRKGMHERLLKEFGDQQADILLGTQMIAKGLDFPNVTLVGVLNADTGLDLPDFRASEHTFDLLAQVSGRAGRANKPGYVVIQTFNPTNYAIELAKEHNYEKFFAIEMNLRYRAGYPPYYYAVKVMASHEDQAVALRAINQIAKQLKSNLAPSTVVLGPSPRPIARMKRRYYYQIVIKYKNDPVLHQLLTQVLDTNQQKNFHDVQITIDPDPQHFM